MLQRVDQISPPRPKPRQDTLEDAYWGFVAAGTLRLQQCDVCGLVRYPPSPNCADCSSESATWATMSGRGRIKSWTIFHRRYFPTLPPPYAVLSVELDEGPMVIGTLLDWDGTRPAIGAPVIAVIQPVAASDDGSPQSICQWQLEQPHPTGGNQ